MASCANRYAARSVDDPEPIGYFPRALGAAWAVNAMLLIFSYWQDPYYLTLLSAFRFQMLATLWLLSIPLLFVFPRKGRWLFVALPLVVSLTFSGYFLRMQPALASGRTLKLGVANILGQNPELSGLATWIGEDPPDILGILEVRSHHLTQLQELNFSHQTLHPQEDNFGIGLLAKTEPTTVEILEGDYPTIVATWTEDDGVGPCRVLVTHPIPPVSPEARVVGDQQVLDLITHYSKDPLPLLVLGDLNSTGWDQRLLPAWEAGLKESRTGHGFLPTWPAQNPILWIPIDHILVPKAWAVTHCSRGPDIGSDHFPLKAIVQRP